MTADTDQRDEMFYSVKRLERSLTRWQGFSIFVVIVALLAFGYIGYLVVSVDDLTENSHRRACKDQATAEVLDAFGASITAAIDGDSAGLDASRIRIESVGSLQARYRDCIVRH